MARYGQHWTKPAVAAALLVGALAGALVMDMIWRKRDTARLFDTAIISEERTSYAQDVNNAEIRALQEALAGASSQNNHLKEEVAALRLKCAEATAAQNISKAAALPAPVAMPVAAPVVKTPVAPSPAAVADKGRLRSDGTRVFSLRHQGDALVLVSAEVAAIVDFTTPVEGGSQWQARWYAMNDTQERTATGEVYSRMAPAAENGTPEGTVTGEEKTNIVIGPLRVEWSGMDRAGTRGYIYYKPAMLKAATVPDTTYATFDLSAAIAAFRAERKQAQAGLE